MGELSSRGATIVQIVDSVNYVKSLAQLVANGVRAQGSPELMKIWQGA